MAQDEAQKEELCIGGTPRDTLVPFSVETCCLEVENDKLAERDASTGTWEREGHLHWIRKESSPSVIRGYTKVFTRFVDCSARGIGQHLQQGHETPAFDV